MKLFAIACVDSNNGIGLNNKIPWYIPEDLNYFKYKTLETENISNVNVVIMGKNTFESLKYKQLRGRINVVISSTLSTNDHKNVIIFNNFENAMDFIESFYKDTVENVFAIGGTRIYEDALKNKNLQGVYLTQLSKNYHCNTFFPQLNELDFNVLDKKYYNYNDFTYSRAYFEVKK